MRNKPNLLLKRNEEKAIGEFKREVFKRFPHAQFILYGSKARGDPEEFSDIDILVLLDEEIDTRVEDTIFDIAYDIELKFDVVISVIVESKQFWESELSKAMPLHWSVEKEGVAV